MKHIIAVNASPRTGWNTAALVREAARGAGEAGAGVNIVDLYKLGKFTGCISCFACKRQQSWGRCACKDALTPVLDEIRQADGLILGTPNYLGEATAGFRALFERLIFQSLTYAKERMCCNEHPIPVLFIMTSNAPDSAYAPEQPYGQMLSRYVSSLNNFVGPTKALVCGDTLQVSDYSKYQWTLFDPEAKKERHEQSFPQYMQEAFRLGYDTFS